MEEVRAMPQQPQPCPGSGQPPAHTYTRRTRGSGGVVRETTAANCPVDHDRHYDLDLVNGKVAPHAQ
jgi:hypothetical protein